MIINLRLLFLLSINYFESYLSILLLFLISIRSSFNILFLTFYLKNNQKILFIFLKNLNFEMKFS